MTVSGTTTFNLDIGDLVQEAFERCGLDFRGGSDYRSARRSLDLLLHEWTNRGLNLWTITQRTKDLVAGQTTYTLDSDVMAVIDQAIRINAGNTQLQVDYYMNQISVTNYANIPTKLSQGRPLQVWIDRQENAPVANFWPTPDASMPYQFVYWAMRYMNDTGTPASNNIDIPTRFLPALTAGLAYHLSVKKAPQLLMQLKLMYDEQWQLASQEDRDRSSVRLLPWVGAGYGV